MKTIGILMVDDYAPIRTGLRALLAPYPDLEVIGEAESAENAVTQAGRLKPDVVLMDLNIPVAGGLAATQQITALAAAPRVLVLTMRSPEEFLIPALRAGASGYLGKDHLDDQLIPAVRSVARGHVFLDSSAVRLLLAQFCREVPPVNDAHDAELEILSAREREVLAHTAGGFSASEIGATLRISPKTVDTYRQRVMEKLGLHHRSELIRFALEAGVLTAAATRHGGAR